MSRFSNALNTNVLIHYGDKALRVLGRAAETVLAWQQRASDRKRLAEMDERQLKDMGLSRGDISREVEKPFWRV